MKVGWPMSLRFNEIYTRKAIKTRARKTKPVAVITYEFELAI